MNDKTETAGVPTMMDSRVLAIFALAATQDGFIKDLIPDAGSAPDLDKNFTRLGLQPDVLNDFITRVKAKADPVKTQAAFLQLNQLMTTLYAEYTPPDCPDTPTLQAIVDATQP